MVINMSSGWNVSLFGCFNHMGPCLIAFCLPFGSFFLQAKAFDQLTGEGLALPCCLQIYVGNIGFGINRKRIREELGIPGRFCNDCMTWAFCGPCAGVQEYIEVRKKTNAV